MRNILVPVLVVTSLAVSSVAIAADSTATGAIASLDAKACTVTLDNKAVYQFAAKCDLSKLKVGEKVTVTFTTANKVNTASAIAPAK